MKHLKKIPAVFLALSMTFGAGAVLLPVNSLQTTVCAAETLTYGDFQYRITDSDTITITLYNGRDADVTVPSEIDGKPVTEIDGFTFMNWTGVHTVYIPKGVTSDLDSVFSHCPNLTDIHVAPNNPMYSSDNGVLYSKDGSSLLNCPQGKKGEYTIPQKVTFVRHSAFQRCPNLTALHVESGNPVYTSYDGVLMTADKTKILRVPQGRTGEYTVPSFVSAIGETAFGDCQKLTAVNLHDGIAEIGMGAFSKCKGLTHAKIPDGITAVPPHLFSSCSALKSVKLPESITQIGQWAFDGCFSLESINIPQGVTKIERSAFEMCSSLKDVTIPSGITELSDQVFENTGFTHVIIPDSVTTINYEAFRGCSSLQSIVIPPSVTTIGRNVLYQCRKVTVYGAKGSAAEVYANENGVPFVELQELKNCSTLSKSTMVLGSTVTVNLQAEGSAGNSLYAVQYKKKTDTKWLTAQSYSENTSVTLKPAKAADYQICVKVKDDTGRIVKKYLTLKVNAKLANSSTVSADTIKLGNTVKVTAKATGGMGDYTYAVLYKKDYDKNWTVKQGYKANSTVSIKPAKKATYNICVKVKDADGSIVKKYFNVKITS